jgi:pimeloyl-ACP methyl ester carboxylesterase
MLKIGFAALMAATLLAGAPRPALAAESTEANAPAPAAKTGYADVNGLHMYYEVRGEGQPTLALHGAYMSSESMAGVTVPLSQSRQVIAMDLQGHGRTGDVDRPLTYEQMADDVAALMDKLGVGQADVFGFSMGGGVAYQLAIRHPEKVRRLVAASATYKTEGMYPELVAMIGSFTAESFAGSPMEVEYKKLAPKPEDFPKLVEKLKTLDVTPQNWPADDIRNIQAPTLVISGDADVIRPEHSVEIYRLRGGGPSQDFMTAPASAELAILPGTTHLGVLMERADLVAAFASAFFDKQGR